MYICLHFLLRFNTIIHSSLWSDHMTIARIVPSLKAIRLNKMEAITTKGLQEEGLLYVIVSRRSVANSVSWQPTGHLGVNQAVIDEGGVLNNMHSKRRQANDPHPITCLAGIVCFLPHLCNHSWITGNRINTDRCTHLAPLSQAPNKMDGLYPRPILPLVS